MNYQMLDSKNSEDKKEQLINGLKQSVMESHMLGHTSSQMKSLMKSFSCRNMGYYDDLHKKYLGRAKQDIEE